MKPIQLSRAADTDLDGILDYSIEHHGRDAAEAYLRTIYATFERLSEFPALGVPEDELQQGSRSFPVGEHRIYYRLKPEALLVGRVLHKRMDARRWM